MPNLNFHQCGDITDAETGDWIGFIDSQGDWRPASGCLESADAIRDELLTAITENPEFPFPASMLQFAKKA